MWLLWSLVQHIPQQEENNSNVPDVQYNVYKKRTRITMLTQISYGHVVRAPICKILHNMSKYGGAARPRLHNTCGTSHTDKHTPGCKDSSRGLSGVVLHTEENKGSCWIDSASPTLIRKKDVPELVDIGTATWPVDLVDL